MRRQQSDLIALLHQHRLRIFTAADFAIITRLKHSTAMEALSRLQAHGIVKRLKRGVWVNKLAPQLQAFEALPVLCAPWPAYVSLQSALSRRGVVEEIPHVIYGITAGRPRRYRTTLGDFHIHHLPAHLIWGFEMRQEGEAIYPLAESEKAFLDLAYLGLTPRSLIGLPYRRSGRWALESAKLRRYAKRFKSERLNRYLSKATFGEKSVRTKPK